MAWDDGAYVNESLNNTWESMGRDFTLVTLPGIGRQLTEYRRHSVRHYDVAFLAGDAEEQAVGQARAASLFAVWVYGELTMQSFATH